MAVVCFDFDDVILDGNLAYTLLKEVSDKKRDVKALIGYAESKHKNFITFFKKAVGVLEGKEYKILKEIVKSIPPKTGYKIIKKLNKNGYNIVIASMNDRKIIKFFLKRHNMLKYVDDIFAPDLETKNGKLTGEISGFNLGDEKCNVPQLIKGKYGNVSNRDIYYIGDGNDDLALLTKVNGIVFNPSKWARMRIFENKRAKKRINSKRLFLIEEDDLWKVGDIIKKD